MKGWGIMLVLCLAIAGTNGASAQDASGQLAELAKEYWEYNLQRNPVSATSLGDRRYDDRMGQIGEAAMATQREDLQAFLDRAEAISRESLSAEDRLTRAALITELKEQTSQLDCGLYQWVVDPLWGPQVFMFNIQSYQPVRTPEEAQMMVKRWEQMDDWLDSHMENLRYGLSQNKVAVKSAVEKTIQTTKGHLERPTEEWAMLKPLEEEHPDWSEADREAFEKGLHAAVEEQIRPAFERYLALLQDEILPAARDNKKPGLVFVPGGDDCYQKTIRIHTSLDLPADEIHQIGLEQVAKINAEVEVLGKKLFDLDTRKEILDKLRTDPELYFTTREEVEEKAESALAKAREVMPQYFGILPKADCVVEPMSAYEEKVSTIAYYRQPAVDGSRPGTYMINTYAPETRPRYEAEALAFHEAIPGHHLQIAIAQELDDIPEFRKHSGVTAFVEGWALYTERLSNEMGLYTDDLDRMGMLSYDSWRACRLVVDTGMHAKGWSRDDAIKFMMDNTALAENNIVNEVDRYITWPGQALAYKIGQLEIFRLRDKAKEELGESFDIREFHDAVLQNGAIALEPLREVIDAYIEEKKSGALAPQTEGKDAG